MVAWYDTAAINPADSVAVAALAEAVAEAAEMVGFEASPVDSAVTVAVGGMTCGHCTSTVEKAVANLPNITGVDVRLDPGSVTAWYDTSAINPADSDAVAALAEAVAEAAEMVGFEASPVDSAAATKNKAQTAAIKSQTVRTAIKLAVSGMYCQSCVTWTSKACQRVKVCKPEYGLG